MKNKLLFLLIGISFCVTGQNANNHWLLGTSDVNFGTNPPTVSTVSNSGNYGDAIVSDVNGNLLFYTDGLKIWNKNHVEIPSEFGYDNGFNQYNQSQPALIIPYPGNPGKYFAISTETSVTAGVSGPGLGYIYNIVDFTNPSYPLGTLFNVSGATPIGSYSDYTLRPMAVIPNSTLTGYYFVCQFQNVLNSYSITSSGISPVATYTLPSSVPYIQSTNTNVEFQNKAYGVLKFAPNGKLGGLVSNLSFHEGPDTYYCSSQFFTIDFNNSTGTFSNFSLIEQHSQTGSVTYREFEFSSDSQKAYLVRDNVYVKDLSSPATAARKLALTGNSSSFPSGISHIQNDKFGNILFASDGISTVGKVENQTNFTSSTLTTAYFTISGGFNPLHVFPQSVQSLDCPSSLTVTTNVTSGTNSKQASQTISASNSISSGAVGIYHAGTSVVLTNGFQSANGSRFRAYIEGCTGTYLGRMASPEDEDKIADNDKETEAILFPNPTYGMLNILVKNQLISSASVSRIADNRIIAQFKGNNSEELSVDLNHLTKGIYVINIQTGNGEQISKKFVKY